jgi:diadenosine tetraphosphate (Ap4A) HIT family hydrolase
MVQCAFCARIHCGDIISQDGDVVFLNDAFPVTPGHLLVIPSRHVESLSDLTPAEQSALWASAMSAAAIVRTQAGVDGVNIGVNDGATAGQTVPHVHIHVIPRRVGDVADPRGGCRWVVPDRASYWQPDTVHSQYA